MSSIFEKNKLPPSKVADLIKEEVLGPQDVKPILISRNKAILPIKVVLCFVILLSAMTSGYFLYKWSISSRGVLLSLAIAMSMTICQTVLPELSIMLAMKRTWQSFVGAFLVGCITLVATSFTMGATIGGIYDSRSVSLTQVDARANQAVSIQSQLQSAREKKDFWKNQLLWAQKEAADASTKASELLATQTDTYVPEGLASAMQARTKAKQAVAETYTRLTEADAEVARLSNTQEATVVIREDFYSWTAKVLKVKPETVEFVMSAFPAIFNEIVAPTMLAIVLFL